VGAPSTAGSPIELVATGQRLLILAVVVNLGVAAVRGAAGDNWAIVGPAVVVGALVSIVALMRLATGLGYSSETKGLMVIFAFVPLASLVMLGIVNARATKALRAAGYRVGFFGAERR
jgi:hypothetical protein